MKRYLKIAATLIMATCLFSCREEVDKTEYYTFSETSHDNTAEVTWNPEDFDFDTANAYYTENFSELIESGNVGACSSWRNGNYHGRNLDWLQGDFGCLIIKMPKGGRVRHSSVALLNAVSVINRQFLKEGRFTGNDKYLPAVVVDGINDAGVAININIVPHVAGTPYIQDGDLTSQCVVRYVLDNAGSVDEAIKLLEGRRISQDLIALADDETHYMISDKHSTAVVEFDGYDMVVTRFESKGNGYYSPEGNPAIMTNMYDYAIERWGFKTQELFENHPLAMGVERWETIRNQYDKAAASVDSNIGIAKSVWYFQNFMVDKVLWYSENAIPSSYGKDAAGWYYMDDEERVSCNDHFSAQNGYWKAAMEKYWSDYDTIYGVLPDPHVEDNPFWETSHTVIYDLDAKKGYLIPFENYYSKDRSHPAPIEITLP